MLTLSCDSSQVSLSGSKHDYVPDSTYGDALRGPLHMNTIILIPSRYDLCQNVRYEPSITGPTGGKSILTACIYFFYVAFWLLFRLRIYNFIEPLNLASDCI